MLSLHLSDQSVIKIEDTTIQIQFLLLSKLSSHVSENMSREVKSIVHFMKRWKKLKNLLGSLQTHTVMKK